MISGPYKIEQLSNLSWFCAGPYQTGNQYKVKEQAEVECDLLNSIYSTGYNAGLAINKDNLKQIGALKDDIAHAYAEAKTWVPDYPFDDSYPTASQAVWACGSSYEGVSKACDDMHELFKKYAPEAYEKAMKEAPEIIKNKILSGK